MAIRIYDSMQRKIVPLATREPGKVTMYVCGPTVYNYIHIGNARTMLWFDFVSRYLRYRGFDVTYVRNYTDVDDKIIERANLEKLPPDAVTKKYTDAFEADMGALGGETPELTVKATEHIGEMVKAIEGLVEKGSAYATEDGNVWFSIENFSDYGKLSGRTIEDLRAGERVEPHEGKRHPLDFSLWKTAKEGEPSWDSPWGPGRPGWHIECSVMSTKYLGQGFDLHGGGSDLIFPHHENEIAQAEGLDHEHPFVRHWMHAGMVQMEAEKMSKSLGNVVLAREVVERFGGEAARYWVLMSTYRAQAVFSEATLNDASQAYERWKTFAEAGRHLLGENYPQSAWPSVRGEDSLASAPGYVTRFIEAMDDDFNSAEAFAVVHDLVREGNRVLEGAQRGNADDRTALLEITEQFVELTGILGFGFNSSEGDLELVGGLLDYLLELREQTRAEKAFDRADQIRERLTSLGVMIEDTPAGPRWRLG
ncbi:MAG: cysteine--tRNA ligase [Actinomycetota bacterium]